MGCTNVHIGTRWTFGNVGKISGALVLPPNSADLQQPLRPLLLTLAILVATAGVALSQTTVIRGTVLAQGSADPLSDALVASPDGAYSVRTDADGSFALANDGSVTVVRISLEDYLEKSVQVPAATPRGSDGDPVASVGTIFLTADDFDRIVVLDRNFNADEQQADENSIGASGTVASLLSASRDPFIQATAFNFNATRFRIRGYDNRYIEAFIDGAPVNDPEVDLPRFYIWSGLNDVTRNRFTTASLESNPFDPSSLGGVTNIDLRAGSQRTGSRVSVANSNRSWRHRVMATHNTGWLANDFAFSFSGSVRYAAEGYIEGTYQQAYAYYAAAEKRFGESRRLSLSILASPSLRGGTGSSVAEVYEITGDNFFNPNWGLQDGKVRNAREYRTNQPVISLGYEWAPSVRTNWTTNVVGIVGRNGQTRLERADAPNPIGTYYQYLPSYSLNEESRRRVTDAIRANPGQLQVQWDNLYAINRRQRDVIEDANGVAGLTVAGPRARYWIEEQRYDPRRVSVASRFRHALTEQWTFHGGLIAQASGVHNFQVLDDPLGASFVLNVNAFAERDLGSLERAQNDADHPNRLIFRGDKFGYDYDSRLLSVRPYAQVEYTGKAFDVFAALASTVEQQWREGHVRNGQFPDRSLGESERVNFTTGTARGGVTYKINGRNYLSARAMYATRAPDFRDVFVSPRTRNDVVPNLEEEQILSYEASYQYQAPGLRAKLTGYRTTFTDRMEQRRFFIETADNNTGFGTFITQGIDSEHLGLEAAVEYDLTPSLEATVAVAAGRYLYTNRPVANAYVDNSGEQLVTDQTIYQQGFYDAQTPQQAGSLSLRYEGRQFYTVTLTGSYTRYAFTDINPTRRTTDALRGLEPGSPRIAQITEQVELPAAVTMDLFASKSIKLDENFLFVTLGVNNLLNDRTIVTGSREQLRYDFERQDPSRFPDQFFYAFGTNYFLQATYQF